jgi:hypothetical protein
MSDIACFRHLPRVFLAPAVLEVLLTSMARLLLNSFAFVGVFLASFSPQLGTSQQIMVKLIDGRNGRTLRNQSVEIWLAEKSVGMPNETVRTNAEGIAFVPIPAQKPYFVIVGESLVDCRIDLRYTGKASTDEANAYKQEVYRFADVLAHGAVGANKCGKATAQPVPGQLVLFVRPPHWWEKAIWE